MGDVREYLARTITAAMRFLANATGDAPGEIMRGAPRAIRNVGAVVAEVPAVGEVVAQAFLAANAAVRYGFDLPGIEHGKLERVRSALLEALEMGFGPRALDAVMQAAGASIEAGAPAGRAQEIAGMTRQ